MASATSYSKERRTVKSNWTQFASPFNCNYFSVRNVGQTTVLIRTSATEEDYDVIAPDAQNSVMAPMTGDTTRFSRGQVVFDLRADTDTDVVVTWVR